MNSKQAGRALVKGAAVAALAFALAGPRAAAAADLNNAVQLGVMFNPIGSVTLLGYERAVSPQVGVGVRVGNLSYDFWDGSYHEWGSGGGFDLTASYFFNGRGVSGPFIGAALGKWNVDWDWYDSTAARRSGWGNSKLTNIAGTFGWNFMLTDSFYVQPALTLGSYSGAGKDNTGTKSSDVGAYGGLSIAAGLLF